MQYRDTIIVYKKVGEGEVLFFIHGLGLNKHIWDLVIQSLSSNYCCITIDLPGSGEAEYIPNLKMEEYVAIIFQIIQQENITTFNIIGHSLGGYIALAFAQQHKGKIKSICLFHSHATIDSLEKIATRKQVIEIVKQRGVKFFFEELILNQFSKPNQIIFKNLIAELTDKSFLINREALIQYQELMINRNNSIEFLSNNKIPVFFIIGEHDTFIEKKEIYKQALNLNCSNIVILKNVAHIGMLEEVENSVRIIKSFIS